MNVDSEIKKLLQQIREAGKQIRWLRQRQAALETLPDGTFYQSGMLDFDKLPHAEVVKVIRAMNGGKWTKDVNTHADETKPRVDYVSEIDGVRVRCWAGEPPPTCRIVEVEEYIPERVIPASTRKVRKMVCTGQAEPAVMAIARTLDPKPAATPEQAP